MKIDNMKAMNLCQTLTTLSALSVLALWCLQQGLKEVSNFKILVMLL